MTDISESSSLQGEVEFLLLHHLIYLQKDRISAERSKPVAETRASAVFQDLRSIKNSESVQQSFIWTGTGFSHYFCTLKDWARKTNNFFSIEYTKTALGPNSIPPQCPGL